MKKWILSAFFFLAVFAVHAQKPVIVAVWNDLSVPVGKSSGGDGRTGDLLLEYFKSEIATHAGLKLAEADVLVKELTEATKKKLPLNDLIREVCTKTSAEVFAMISTSRNQDDGSLARVVLYDAKGDQRAVITQPFKNVRESDILAIALARQAAIHIRGNNPVDKVNLAREKRMYEEIFKMPLPELKKVVVPNPIIVRESPPDWEKGESTPAPRPTSDDDVTPVMPLKVIPATADAKQEATIPQQARDPEQVVPNDLPIAPAERTPAEVKAAQNQAEADKRAVEAEAEAARKIQEAEAAAAKRASEIKSDTDAAKIATPATLPAK